MTFFGDDTWLKLFPGHFQREDGTTSFFVADYTEVRLVTIERKRNYEQSKVLYQSKKCQTFLLSDGFT